MTILHPTSSFINPWTRKPQPSGGNFYFSGQIRLSPGAARVLGTSEIVHILNDLRQSAMLQKGLHHLQVYTHLNGSEVWISDNGQQDTCGSSGGFSEYDYFTIILPEEY